MKNWPILFGLLFTISTYSQWEMVIQEDNITVYNKPGEDGYSFAKSEGIIKATPEEVYDFLTDISKYPLWVANCKETRVIKNINKEEIIYYSLYRLPPPARNRSSISNIKMFKETNNKFVFETTPAPQSISVEDDAVRMTRFSQKIELYRTTKNNTKIVLEGAYDPAGIIPSWITDKFMKQGPYESIKDIRKYTE